MNKVKVAALVKYNPCSIHGRGGVFCPFFVGWKKCKNPLGFCEMPEYDKWFKEVTAGTMKNFYPRRIRLLEIPGAVLLLYHSHKRKIVGEASIVKVTHQNNIHRYWFDEFVFYPSPIDLTIIHTDPRLQKIARIGRWKLVYLYAETVEEIRELSGLKEEIKERLKRELEAASKSATKFAFLLYRSPFSIMEKERRKLLDIGIDSQVLEKTEQIVSVAMDQKIHVASWKFLFYASLYLAYRSLSVPKRLRDVGKMGELDERKFRYAVKALRRKLELKLPRISAKDWVLHYADGLGASKKTVKIAVSLAQEETQGQFRGKSPISIAATAFYLACLKTNERMTQKKIGETFGVSTVTLKNLSKIFRPNS